MNKLIARVSFVFRDVLTYAELRQAYNFELIVAMYTLYGNIVPTHDINKKTSGILSYF